MSYRDIAIEHVQGAISGLKTTMQDALAGQAYSDVSALARLAESLATLIRDFEGTTAAAPAKTPHDDLAKFDEERATIGAVGTTPSASRSGKRGDYPRYLRDGDRLVKVAWSKKERQPYEHRAPREIVQLIIDRISARYKHVGDGKIFEAAHIMPLKSPSGEEYPSYQVYLGLGWLRHVGVMTKKGREGYSLKTARVTPDRLDSLWNSLPQIE